jgi:hypothetical protein
VSKSVVKYQKYVHMKACLAWRHVKMTLIPAPGKANCTEAMGYHPISLLFCMQKIMKKLLARHIRDKSLGLCPCTALPICLQTREVHRNGNASCDFTYTGSSGKQVSYI